jgi:cold shock CspA family protein
MSREEGTKMLGRVKSFYSDRGFGFIIDEAGFERFFHIYNVEGRQQLSKGEVVAFEPYLEKKDRYAATAVRIVQSDNRTEVLHEISEWKREAKLEDMFRYFYYTRDIASLENGNRCYVLGRKGTEKRLLESI